MIRFNAITTFALAAFALVGSAIAKGPAAGWTCDFDQALKTASKEDKPVLVSFTGSDWCPGCIYMSKNVFSKKEFIDAASKDFVLLEIDLPNGDQALREKNVPYAQKYQIEGFPTVVLVDDKGKEFSRFFATDYPKVDALLKHLDQVLERRDLH